MTDLVLLILIFLATGIGFLAVNLLVGRLIRPDRPSEAKGSIYECGEPSIGSSWIQFDLRFYVVALLFVIFDVEMAFFFPWATVFGKANHLAQQNIPIEERSNTEYAILPASPQPITPVDPVDQANAARHLAKIAFCDLLIFFGVLLVGFAYLWKRGDLDWVRSTLGQTPTSGTDPPASEG